MKKQKLSQNCKIPKISPGASIWMGFCMKGFLKKEKLRYKIDWACNQGEV